MGAKYCWPLNEASMLNGPDLVTNGTFDTDSDWTKEAGWTIGSGVATCGSGSSSIYQSTTISGITFYVVSFDVTSYTSGSVTFNLYGNTAPDVTTSPSISAIGSYRYVLLSKTTPNGNIGFTSSSFIGSVDNVVVRELNAYSLETQTGAKGVATDIYPCLDYAGSGTRWYEFDGVNDYCQISDDDSFTISGDFTFMARVKATSLSNECIVSKYQTSAEEYIFRIYSNKFQVLAGSGDYQSPTISTNTWYNVAFVYDDSETSGQFYINGSSVTTDGSGDCTTSNTSAVVKIGAYLATSGGFNGNISMVRIFNTALSSDEVAYYSEPSNPIKAADITAGYCVLNLNAEGLFGNIWLDRQWRNTNAGSFVVGKSYKIVTVGTTDFTAIGAASNTVGVSFTATGVGSGTGVAESQTIATVSGATAVIPPESNLGAGWFNGSTSKVTQTGMDGLTGDITIMWWVLAQSNSTSFKRILFNTKVDLLYNTLNSLAFSRDQSTYATSSYGAFTPNVAHYICITSSSSGVTNIYIDGVLSGSPNQSAGTPSSNTTYYIGDNNAGTGKHIGWIKDLKIEHRILSQSEITELYQKYSN